VTLIVGYGLTVMTDPVPCTALPLTLPEAVIVAVVPTVLGKVQRIAPKLPVAFVDNWFCAM